MIDQEGVFFKKLCTIVKWHVKETYFDQLYRCCRLRAVVLRCLCCSQICVVYQVWSSEDLSLVGVLRGHRRGVWCVNFSPVDQVLLTSSSDCTMKLWALSDLSCIKVIQYLI